MKRNPTFSQVEISPGKDNLLSGLIDPFILHHLPLAFFICDIKGNIVHYNKKAMEFLGQLPGRNGKEEVSIEAFRLFYPDGRYISPGESPLTACLADGLRRENVRVIMERPDLTRIPVKMDLFPLKDEQGNLGGLVNFIDNIPVDNALFSRLENDLRESEARYLDLVESLERKVENKLVELKFKNEDFRKSEERYHKMIEEVEDYAIILLDRNGIIQNWNKGAEKIKGYKEEEIVGKSFSNFYLPEDQANGLPQKLLNEAKEKGKAIHEGWRMRKDGSRFWGSIVLTALHDNQKNLIGYSKVTRDLTDRKIAQDKMEEYTRMLKFQNQELEQFAYAASHDLKEPLRKIHLYNCWIAENPENILDERSREYLNRSLNAVLRMGELIEDLLTYSRTTTTSENFGPVKLNDIVEEIKFLNREEFEQKDAAIEWDDLPEIRAVSFQIKQLMFNLINNSIKYKHPDRDVRIKIQCELIKGTEIADPGAVGSNDYYKISVIDNGIGFEPQYAERIFDIFQRLNNLPGSRGSGIGLAICKRIVQNHQGFIHATGKENQGARFDIYLPRDL